MAHTTNITIEIDTDLKERADTFFQGLGLDMASAINMFVRRTIEDGKLPFIDEQPDEDTFYSIDNQSILLASIKEAEEGKFIRKTLDDLEAMVK